MQKKNFFVPISISLTFILVLYLAQYQLIHIDRDNHDRSPGPASGDWYEFT